MQCPKVCMERPKMIPNITITACWPPWRKIGDLGTWESMIRMLIGFSKATIPVCTTVSWKMPLGLFKSLESKVLHVACQCKSFLCTICYDWIVDWILRRFYEQFITISLRQRTWRVLLLCKFLPSIFSQVRDHLKHLRSHVFYPRQSSSIQESSSGLLWEYFKIEK